MAERMKLVMPTKTPQGGPARIFREYLSLHE
jgi:hypothetical protein